MEQSEDCVCWSYWDHVTNGLLLSVRMGGASSYMMTMSLLAKSSQDTSSTITSTVLCGNSTCVSG